MPFVTEEIYSKLYEIDESIMISNYSDYSDEFIFEEDEMFIETIKNIITEIRNVRANMNVHPSKKSKLIFVSKEYRDYIENSDFLEKLGFANSIEIREEKGEIPDNAIAILNKGIEVYIPFEELVDIKEEIERLEGEKKKLEAEVLRGEKMLSNPGFVSKAPEAKINEEKTKLANYKEKLEQVITRLNNLK